jgi:hypothetical protein
MSNIVIINKRKAVRIISGDLRNNDCIGSNTIKFMILSDNVSETVTVQADVESDGNGSGGANITNDATGMSYYSTLHSNSEIVTLPTNTVLKLEISASANTEYVTSRGINMLLIGGCERKAIMLSGSTSVTIKSGTLGSLLNASAVQSLYANDPESGGGLGGGLIP